MNERLRIAIVAGCLFVAGLHLRTTGALLRDGWFGPYAGPSDDAPARDGAAPTSRDEVGAPASDDAAYLALEHGGDDDHRLSGR